MKPVGVIAFLAALCSVACRPEPDVLRGAADPGRAAQIALAAFPTVRGRLAVARRTWPRGDSTLVQLAGVMPGWVVAPASESTLVVWIAPSLRVVRSQWVIDGLGPARRRSNDR